MLIEKIKNSSKNLLRFCLFIFLFCALNTSYAQKVDGESIQKEYQMHIGKTTDVIKIDGVFDEPIWSNTDTTSPFWRKFPNDEGRPVRKTSVKITYDDKFLYFAVTAYDSGKAFIQSLKRDVGHDGNDCFGITLDPTNQRTNGFIFIVNAFNAQSEDQLPFSDFEEATWSWDNKWYSATKRYEDKWTAEIAIPFKSIRYSSEKLLWGLNFVRVDTKTNEYSTWTHIPVNFRSMDLGYTGAMIWKEPPPAAGSNMVFIPYVTGDVKGDQENSVPSKMSANAGFDAKVALNSSLNMDLTVNPDFSQVEVDQQVTNLSRFSIFFPERRTFFLENSDLFSQYGIPPIRPFYSRTIGLDKDGNKIPILYGARISGNITKSTRIGVMNMQTGRKGDYSPENYSAISINQKVLKRSVIKAYYLDRENFQTDEQKKKDPLNAWGRNAGLELNFNNLKGTWGGWGAYHHSFKPGIAKDNHYIDAGFNYNGRNFNFVLDAGTLGTNYYTDMGFVERINNYDAVRDTVIRMGFKQLFTQVGYKIFPKQGIVNNHNFSLTNFLVLNPDNTKNEGSQEFEYNLQFKNTGFIFLFATNNDVRLQFPSSFTDATPIPAGTYKYQQGGLGFQTDFRKPVSILLRLAGGGFYNGQYQSIRTVLTLRKQPHLNIALQAEYNKLVFPDPYGSDALFLIAPRIELNFSTKLFWTTFIQYNTQRNNFNINSRLQYRFKPMSDFFLVYTDNYFTDPLFRNKNRAIVFKLNYWLNI